METDHYTSLAYYRLIENADRRELPRISGTAYSLFGTEFNDQDELAGIFTQLVEQTISLEGKKIYLSIVYECQLESEPRARLILSHLCSFESEPPKHRSSNDPDGRSPHSYLGHRI